MGNSVDAQDRTLRPVTAGDREQLADLALGALRLDPGEGGSLVELFLEPAMAAGTGLVAVSGAAIIGVALGSVHGERGYVDLFAVAEDARRRGVGTALLHGLETRLRELGASTLMIGGNGNRYAWPGIDLGYTAALRLAASLGYAPRGDALNMDVDLHAWRPGSAPGALRRGGAGLTLRRAQPADWNELGAFVAREFTDGWRDEVAIGVSRERPTVFVALREDRFVGFGCHGLYRRGWFGPVGTADAERGNGIGEALLRLCLDDIAADGLTRAQISWVGPTAFYERTVGAVAGRRFAIVGKDVLPA